MTFQKLEDKIDETAKKTKAAVKDRSASTLEDAASAAGKAGAVVEDAARRAGEQAEEIGQQAYATGERVARTVARQVESQPIGAVLIAGALGIAVGYALARRL